MNELRARSVVWLAAAVVLAAISASAVAQTAPEVFTETIEVQIFNLEVVVTDKDGLPVAELEVVREIRPPVDESDNDDQAALDQVTSVKTEDGWVARVDLYYVALDESGASSDVVSLPLSFMTAKKPGSNDVAGYETELQVHRKTTKLAVAALDRLSGETFVTVLDV